MTARFLLDANALIALLGGDPNLVGRVSQCDRGEVITSAIAFAEVSLGSWRGRSPSLAILSRLSELIPIKPFDIASARIYAQLPFERGSFDRLIAAQAIAYRLTVVTANGRDFADLKNLAVEDWSR